MRYISAGVMWLRAIIDLPRLYKEAKSLKPYFDSTYYAQQDVHRVDFGLPGVYHYLIKGHLDGLDPAEWFSTSYYKQANPDTAGVNPFLHYIKHGKEEGRSPMKEIFEDQRSSAPEVTHSVLEDQRTSAITEIHKDISKEVISLVSEHLDSEFYVKKYLLNKSHKGCVIHYLTQGYKLGFDPHPRFSTLYYLRTNPDIVNAKLNPYFHYLKHGKNEGRSAIGAMHSSIIEQFNPLVSVIIPNYNHAAFIVERLDSIVNQTYKNIEIIVLDDCSKDNSVEIIKEYSKQYPELIRVVINEVNSGNVFKQWRKGLNLAKGEIIWICESDDLVEPSFLKTLYKYFVDRSIMIAFGRIQFIDDKGAQFDGLDGYRQGAEAGIWGTNVMRPANEWFANGFGVRNIIPNVGGCLIRNQRITDDVWEHAEQFKILGDWYLYARLSGSGQLVFDPMAVSYFRQHGNNTSVTSFKQDFYYREHELFMRGLKERWDIPEETVGRFVNYIEFQYDHHRKTAELSPFAQLVQEQSIKSLNKKDVHIVIGFLGFKVGGGELFPIHLANALSDKENVTVSMLALDRKIHNQTVHDTLYSHIPVYSIEHVNDSDHFFSDIGADFINTHYVGIEYQLLLDKEIIIDIPYVVTLHGSYEVSNISDDHYHQLVDRVHHWVYTADKNIGRLKNLPIENEDFTKLSNAMAVNENRFELTREDLNISKSANVYGLMARAIQSKGWEEAILAFQQVLEVAQDSYLLLVGDGGIKDDLEEKYASDRIKFLGFQSNVNGFFRLCDICVLPTRFKGESYPLVLIQSLQVGTPIVSVDIGEIRDMIQISERDKAGIVIENTSDNTAFINDLSDAMISIINPSEIKRYQNIANKLGEHYSIDRVSEDYLNLFKSLWNEKIDITHRRRKDG